MFDLLIRGAHVVDPLNHINAKRDIGIRDGKISEVSESLEGSAKKEISAAGKVVIPGIIDMHTHMRTVLGHPHAQRMIAKAGVCTTLDMAGPTEDILSSIPTSGSGVNIAIVEAARAGHTLTCDRPSESEQSSFIDKYLEEGAIGIKLLGGHFPMDADISASLIELANEKKAWVAWHAGSKEHGSDIEGLKEAVACAGDKFLHLAHVNSYCRGQIKEEKDEALEAIETLKAYPNIFSESYLSPLNGTRIIIENDKPISKVTSTCLKKLGFSDDYAGMKAAIAAGAAGVLVDDGRLGTLLSGDAGVRYWEEKKTACTGSFAVNPAVSRFLLAQAKRSDGSFVVDSFSTDGGCYPRNVIVENGLLLVRFGALTLSEFAVKASLNGARALGLPGKGHLSVGADADITILDTEGLRAFATIVAGSPIMLDGELCGKDTAIICDERGASRLQKRGIRHIVKQPFNLKQITDRFVL